MPETHDVPKPTASEVAILRVLWDRGPSTVRDVVNDLNSKGKAARGKTWGYTTALKFLQIMDGKGLVRRDDSHRSHVYRPSPAAQEQPMQRRLVADLMDRAFGGSVRNFVMQALAASKASPDEMAEIRQMLGAAKAKKR